MGIEAFSYFTKARKIGGLPASIRLATLAKISSLDAKSMDDTHGLLAKMEKAFRQLEAEYAQGEGVTETTIEDKSAELVKKLRQYIQIFSDLIAIHSDEHENVEAMARRITHAISEAIEVERASIWLYDKEETGIACIDLYERSKHAHSSGLFFRKADFPNYFKTLATSRTLSASNARKHPGTREFLEVYLKPMGIRSLLDVPIFAGSKMVGVVCHEHTETIRHWTSDEENFAYLVSNMLGIFIERQNRS